MPIVNDATCLTRSGFDLNVAVLLAHASDIVYEKESDIKTWAQAHGFNTGVGEFDFFDEGNIQGFWCTAQDVALLAFRGTNNFKQWMRDAQVTPASHPWGRVHRGFKGGVDNVEMDLRKFDEVAAKAKHVWLCGHSLGGALAVIAAARLKMKGVLSTTYTYGQPMVGLSGFAERFAIEMPSRLYRFINQSDIVPRLPSPLGLVYQHTGIAKRIVEPGRLEVAMKAVEKRAQSLELSVQTAATYSYESTLPAPELLPAELKVNLELESGTLATAQAVAAAGIEDSMLIESELPPVSPEQFAALEMSMPEGMDIDTPAAIELEGFIPIPWFDDHKMKQYIQQLTRIRDQQA